MSPPDMGCSVVVRIVERKGRKSTAEGCFFRARGREKNYYLSRCYAIDHGDYRWSSMLATTACTISLTQMKSLRDDAGDNSQ
jgi:hypothetical protein